MPAIEFVIETLSHFVREVDGPPPGVPLRVDAGFERDLVSLCLRQNLSPLIAESLSELALPPSISRISVARIEQHAADLAAQRSRRLSLLGKTLAALNEAGVESAVLGEAWTSTQPCLFARFRPLENIDLLVREHQWMETVGVLRSLGFLRAQIQPRLASQREASAAEALRYHQYFVPLVMRRNPGDHVRVTFRVIDIGDPGRDEPAWAAATEAVIDGSRTRAVSPEDQLVRSVVSLGVEGMADLSLVMDAAHVAHKHAASIDWDSFPRRLGPKGLYPAFYFLLEHACEILRIPRVIDRLTSPSPVRRRLFDMWWRTGEVDYTGETVPVAGRFVFGLIESKGVIPRMKWLWRSLFPRAEWVRSVYGRPCNLWLRLKFIFDVKSGRRRRAARVPVGPALEGQPVAPFEDPSARR